MSLQAPDKSAAQAWIASGLQARGFGGILPLGTGYCCAIYGGLCYIGGLLPTSAGFPSDNIVSWDGSKLGAVGSGLPTSEVYGQQNGVLGMTVWNSKLAMIGDFTGFGGINTVVTWDGTSFVSLGDPGAVVGNSYIIPHAIMDWGGTLTIAMTFQYGIVIMTWNGSAWSVLSYYNLSPPIATFGGPGTSDVRALAVYNNTLYAGGRFSTVYNNGPYLIIYNVAARSGATWAATAADELDQSVKALLVWGGNLIAAGDAPGTGGSMQTRLASFSGSAWSDVSSQHASAVIRCLASWGSDLAVGGDFATIDTATVGRIAHWDGSAWHDFAGGFAGSPSVFGLIEYDVPDPVQLVAVGDMRSATGGAALGGIAIWDGSAWSGATT